MYLDILMYSNVFLYNTNLMFNNMDNEIGYSHSMQKSVPIAAPWHTKCHHSDSQKQDVIWLQTKHENTVVAADVSSSYLSVIYDSGSGQ